MSSEEARIESWNRKFGIDNEKGAKKLSQEMLKNPMMKHTGDNIISLKPQETKEIPDKARTNREFLKFMIISRDRYDVGGIQS